MQQMKRIVMAPFIGSSTSSERNEAWLNHLKERAVPRDGLDGRAGSVVTGDGNQSDIDSESEDESGDAAVESTLKKMANVRKKKRSAVLLHHLLGSDGQEAMHNAKEMHRKEKIREKKKELLVLVANRHFERKMERRMLRLHEKKMQSKTKTYTRRSPAWRSRYRQRMIERRVDM
jgi:hypothetical protein